MDPNLEKPFYEFLGTALLVLLGNSVVANVLLPKTKGHGTGWLAITLGWGMAVFVAVWCVGEVSGGHINPAVTIGLAAAGKFAWSEVLAYVVAQMLGAIVGAMLVYLAYRDHYAECENGDDQLGTFCNAPAIPNTFNNLMTEVIGTFVLVLGVMLAASPSITIEGLAEPKEFTLGALGALHVGLLVFAIGLCLGGPTGYAINPARDLGPRIAHAMLPLSHKRDNNWGYSWIPVVGPILGGLLAAALASGLS